jgi:hypothetical protein
MLTPNQTKVLKKRVAFGYFFGVLPLVRVFPVEANWQLIRGSEGRLYPRSPGWPGVWYVL